MRMDDVGLQRFRQPKQALFDRAHHREGVAAWQLRQQAGRPGRAVKVQAVGFFFGHASIDLLGAGQVIGVPAHFPLVAQDGGAAEGVAGVQRQRVVEDVEDFHDYCAMGFRQTSQNPSQDKSFSDKSLKGVASSGRTAQTSSGEASNVGFRVSISKPLCATASR